MLDKKLPKKEALLALHDIYNQPFIDLMLSAQTTFRAHFQPNTIQLSTLLNIKTGHCPEDCTYCSQSVHYNTELEPEKLKDVHSVIADAKKAKQNGATRFCLGAAWRSPRAKALNQVCEMITEIKSLGLETCATLGMINSSQAAQLKQAGLDYYNHNLDTSEDFYPNVVTTRKYQDRLDTLKAVQGQKINVCSGGIIGLGESLEDRLSMLLTLSRLEPYPQSVPINLLVPIPGTPLANNVLPTPIELARLIATARIIMPKAYVRLSAGRMSLSDEAHALCFLASANSIFTGDVLLTTANPSQQRDHTLIKDLGLVPERVEYYPNQLNQSIPCTITTNPNSPRPLT